MRFEKTEIPPPKLINALRSYNLLPAIIFMPTRRKCDEAATEVALDKSQKTDAEKERRRNEIYLEYVAENPEIKTHKHRKMLIRAGIAAHHAGHIPAWKLLVEKMMASGLLNAIFATTTVAAGVDFPARTVVLQNADTRGNDGWRAFRASELQQMTGRAGRRGRDNVGFIVLIPGQFQNPPKIATLLKSPPDALESKFRATYTSLLNLLDAFGDFKNVRDIAEKSFAFRDAAHKILRLEKQSNEREKLLRERIKNSGFDFSIEDVRGFERLTSARLRLQEKPPATRFAMRREWLEENVQAGRIVTQGRNGKRFFLVINVSGDKISAMRDDGQGASFELSRINRVFAKKYPLDEATMEDAFYETYEHKNPPLDEPRLSLYSRDADAPIELLDQIIEKFAPENTGENARKDAVSFLWEATSDAEFVEKTKRDVDYLKNEIWLPFERRARVLDHFGYLDFAAQKITERGRWLADLRVDRPLLVGEALRHDVFRRLETKQMAGLMASIAADSDRNYGELHLSDKLLATLSEFEEIIYGVSGVEWKNQVEPTEEINYSAAAAAETWADGASWERLVALTKAEEGDLVRLLSRTGEALMQIAYLKDANPAAADLARATAEIILREPIR